MSHLMQYLANFTVSLDSHPVLGWLIILEIMVKNAKSTFYNVGIIYLGYNLVDMDSHMTKWNKRHTSNYPSIFVCNLCHF